MYNRFYNFVETLSQKFEKIMILSAIRQGLIYAIPALLVGSFALLFSSFPVEKYQLWLESTFGSSFQAIFSHMQGATLSIIALVLTMTISYSYAKKRNMQQPEFISVVAVCAYLTYSGTEGFEIFAPACVFSAMIIAILAPSIFIFIFELPLLQPTKVLSGSDREFRISLISIAPTAVVLTFFAFMRLLVTAMIGDSNYLRVTVAPLQDLFSFLGSNVFSGILFMLFVQLLWFFGIHGSNVMDDVANQVFEGNLEINQQLVAAGQLPTEILSKTFFDSMVVMGGCGSAICLLLALFIGDRRRNMRSIGKIGALPVLFNINEILIFGIPIVLNPVFFIPFITTPIVLLLISYGATAMGLVPVVCGAVEWTTPVLLSGYVATGSLAGSFLQLINIIVGTAIYMPFVRIAGEMKEKSYEKEMKLLISACIENEEKGLEMRLITRVDKLRSAAEVFLVEFKDALKSNKVELFYQPLIGPADKPMGGEALCRWHHPIFGYVYPPILVRLAEEAGIADAFGYALLEIAMKELKHINDEIDANQKIFVNITAEQLNSPDFEDKIKELLETTKANPKNLGIELTEKTILADSTEVSQRLSRLQEQGISLSVDDFGMGHTSLLYLQHNNFNEVKLDGSLIKRITENENSCSIVASIVELSKTLNFQIVSEYVETKEQRDLLKKLCPDMIYQGYLYSKALPAAEFEDYIRTHK